MMAAHQKQAGGETKAPAARAGTLEVIPSWGPLRDVPMTSC